jgi:Kef-type K+ transport system membrane component KefB
MLAAAGLGASWVFRKARVLAIFDDLDTILLMVPLQVLLVGFRWQLAVLVAVVLLLLSVGWRSLGTWRIPLRWPWVLGYAAALAVLSEAVVLATAQLDSGSPVHLEVLLPAFVLGCVMKRPRGGLHELDACEGQEPGLDSRREQQVATFVAASFMVLVGLSMPPLGGVLPAAAEGAREVMSGLPPAGEVALHVLAVTVLINLGKLVPALCYRREASVRERLALSVALFPRGEVGAGVLVLSLSYGIDGLSAVVAALSLALNLMLTGAFIVVVRKLIAPAHRAETACAQAPTTRWAPGAALRGTQAGQEA